MNNKMKLTFLAVSENEQFARTAVTAFIMNLNPTIEQITDIKTAVSEAVTNCVVHGYPDCKGDITVECEIASGELHIKITDFGVGIQDVKRVLEPFYTSKPLEERAGMGFTIMRTFMDSFEINSELNVGTTVLMSKQLTKIA